MGWRRRDERARRVAGGGKPPPSWRVVQQQIPGLIDGTTGALDFPETRTRTYSPSTPARTAGCASRGAVTRYPGAEVHTPSSQGTRVRAWRKCVTRPSISHT